MNVKLCRECRHSMPEPGSEWNLRSMPEPGSEWNLRCMNAEVNKRDAWALAGSKAHGSCARDERKKKWFAPCGMKGKLWEEKQ